jgi:hypothetical protein
MLFVTAGALADDKAACLQAASKGQRLRDQHDLLAARDQFRVCSAASCPGVVQRDCTAWLADVDKTLPTVVVTAKDGAGADLVDVVVTLDGQPLQTRLDGRAVPMNAGPHTFHFEGPGGTKLDQQVVISEGRKEQTVAVVLGPKPAAGPPPGGEQPPPASPSTSSSPLRTVGWVLGGAGVVGLGIATAFGLSASSDKSSAHCDANNVCDPGTVSGIKSAALASDVAWIAGGVLLAGGAALVLFAPKGTPEEKATLRIAPMVGVNAGGVVAGGSW